MLLVLDLEGDFDTSELNRSQETVERTYHDISMLSGLDMYKSKTLFISGISTNSSNKLAYNTLITAM